MAPKGDGISRKTPRRLFSFDSVKVSTRRSSSEASNESESQLGRHAAGPSKPSTLNLVLEEHDGETANGTRQKNWTENDIVESPRDENLEDDFSFPSVIEKTRSVPRRPTRLSTNVHTRPSTPESTPPPSPSPSIARWEHLRQHVLPQHVTVPPPRPSTPPTHSQQPSSASSLSVASSRPQTPKPSRLARLGFRQVVEHAREVAVDETRKFSDEIQRACWSARFMDSSKTSKAEREPYTGTMGSSLYLPFMSTASIPLTGSTNTSVVNLTQNSKQKHDLRRPQSMQSLPGSSRSVPSLKYLYQLILQRSSPSTDGLPPPPLPPCESLILSTLLRPFLVSESGPRIDEERWFAVETFDVLVKTWDPPSDDPGGVERCVWCCKAVLVSSSIRSRLMKLLSGLVLPSESSCSATTPASLRALTQALFSLAPAFVTSDPQDQQQIKKFITENKSGCCGELEQTSVEEEYNALHIAKDTTQLVRDAVIQEALMGCLENGAEATRRWILKNVVEEHWPLPLSNSKISFTPLLSAIHARKLTTFTRASLDLLVDTGGKGMALDTSFIVRFLQTRVIPEAEAVQGSSAVETRGNVVRLILELIGMEEAAPAARWGLMLVCDWYRKPTEWKSAFEKTVEHLMTDSDWPVILRIVSPLMRDLPDDVRKSGVAFALPLLYDRLVADPPAHPCLPLTALLDAISQSDPQIFYKPLFACAASGKEFTVVNHLCIITAIAKFLRDFWIRDAEMMSVALMRDVGAGKSKSVETSSPPTWGKARLGQSVLLMELIGYIQSVRHAQDLSPTTDVETVKFVLTLETRLGILLEAKEKQSLVPPSQRLLFCVLFREIRLLTRSLKTATWLPRAVSWLITHGTEERDDDSDLEFAESMTRLQALYATAREGSRSSTKHRSTMLLSPTLNDTFPSSLSGKGSDIFAAFAAKAQLLESYSKGFVPKVLKLLVALSALLTPADYRRIGPLLWEQHLDGSDAKITSSACFLAMQCAEKTPVDFLAIIEAELQSSDAIVKLNAVRRISTLTNWRFQITSQHIITDRMHRAFKLARGPLPFVATDVGTSLFVREDDPNELKDALPLELRKRLSEIGWAQEDRPVDIKMEYIRTPMSLLPVHQLDRLDAGLDASASAPHSPNMSPSPSPQRGASPNEREDAGLLRRNSSTGGPSHGVKRRAVFVPSLAGVFPRLATLAFDQNLLVASAARATIIDVMRNDPGLLTRPVLDLLVDDQKNMPAAISILRALLHVRRVLPPPLTHHVFNNLAGFLKFGARQVDNPQTLHDFAYTIPILSKLVTQVSEMSIRDIRRAKIEQFLIPSGSLWFPPSAPPGEMFPRSLGPVRNPFQTVPARLVSMTLIRVSQNMLFLAMLKKNHQDVQLIRKNMTRLVLPSKDSQFEPMPLELKDFVPHTQAENPGPGDGFLRGLSLILARSYLLLVAQVFRSMSRHLNDRNELSVLIDGLNRILLAHGDDIGIVTQAMIALMVASTRFRRLFNGGGYTLFMPAVLKVYTESESHSGIRMAIEYTVNRFYALHHDAFIFQSLDSMAHIMMVPDVEGEWVAKSVYSLFSALRRGVQATTADAAGIHDTNKIQEREALIVTTAEEKPQTFLASLRAGSNRGKGDVMIDLPEEYETKRLAMDDFVRLFLTVIAHDPSILRAEQFMRFFRFLAPDLYHASSSARTVLREGIDALGVILTRVVVKTKASDASTPRPLATPIAEPLSSEAYLENQLSDKSKSASDIMSMRLDYLSLVVAFTQAGGQLGSGASHRIVELIKIMLRDSSKEISEPISVFFTDYTRTSLIREPLPSLKEVVTFLNDLSPVISAYALAVDFSGVFETVSLLVSNPTYGNESAFSHLVVTQICAAGLAACELAGSEKLLLTLPLRPSLVSLLAQSVFLRGGDVIAEIEKRAPSYEFLAGVVLPFIMHLKTGAEIVSEGERTESWHRTVHAGAWARLLAYAMSACTHRQTRRDSSDPERSKSQDRGNKISSRDQITTLITALQIVKAIVIRAEADLSSCLPGIWSRVGAFFKTILAEGNANFALEQPEYSPSPSPVPSPRNSGQFDLSNLRSPSIHTRAMLSPRIVDYSLWSLLELLCLYRNPLMLQMRLFMREKVVSLDQELRSHSATPRGRRVSSVFSKPRGRFSGLPSPDASPRVSMAQSFTHEQQSISFTDAYGRQPGFQQFPGTSQDQLGGARIVHLGPVASPSASSFRRSLSPSNGISAGGMRRIAKSTKVKSLALIQSTYRRIRVVQTCMGYTALLPIPNHYHGEQGIDEAHMRTWTLKHALDEIIKETRELIDEFEETFRDVEDDMVLIDPDQSMSF